MKALECSRQVVVLNESLAVQSQEVRAKEKVVGRVEEERQVKAVNRLRKKVETKSFLKTHRKQSVRKNGKTAISRDSLDLEMGFRMLRNPNRVE